MRLPNNASGRWWMGTRSIKDSSEKDAAGIRQELMSFEAKHAAGRQEKGTYLRGVGKGSQWNRTSGRIGGHKKVEQTALDILPVCHMRNCSVWLGFHYRH